MGTTNNINYVEYFGAESDGLMHGWISAFHILYPETTICAQTRQKRLMGGQSDQWSDRRLWVVMFGLAVVLKWNSEQVCGWEAVWIFVPRVGRKPVGCCSHRAPSQPPCKSCSDLARTALFLLLVTQGQPIKKMTYVEGTSGASSFSQPGPWVMALLLTARGVNIATSSPRCRSNKATDTVVVMPPICPFLSWHSKCLYFLFCHCSAFPLCLTAKSSL